MSPPAVRVCDQFPASVTSLSNRCETDSGKDIIPHELQRLSYSRQQAQEPLSDSPGIRRGGRTHSLAFTFRGRVLCHLALRGPPAVQGPDAQLSPTFRVRAPGPLLRAKKNRPRLRSVSLQVSFRLHDRVLRRPADRNRPRSRGAIRHGSGGLRPRRSPRRLEPTRRLTSDPTSVGPRSTSSTTSRRPEPSAVKRDSTAAGFICVSPHCGELQGAAHNFVIYVYAAMPFVFRLTPNTEGKT